MSTRAIYDLKEGGIVHLVPRSDRILQSTNGFTLGREYLVVKMEGNCYIVNNDNGHERAILPGEPSPHLVSVSGDPGGHFEIIEKE